MSQYTENASQNFLDAIAQVAPGEHERTVTLGEILDRLDERAYGLLFLLLALPCLVPGLPGAQLFAAAILVLSVQLLFGRREPWLPQRVLNIRLSSQSVARMISFAQRRLSWIERLSRPRFGAFSTGLGERIAALFVSIAALAVMMPITNTVPSVAITLIAIGLVQRDGLLCLTGCVVASVWTVGLIFTGWSLAAGASWLTDGNTIG